MSVRDMLGEYALGTLAPELAGEVERALEGSPVLREALRGLEEDLAGVAWSLPAIAPSAGARGRLLAAIEAEHRYAPFFPALASMIDLGLDRVRALVSSMLDPASWEDGPCAGVRLMHFDAGPRAEAFDAGFVRLDPGATFPAHRHEGREVVLVLEGGYVELDSGLVVRAGDVARREAGSSHAFRALPESPLVFAVVLGGPIGPPD